jgi:hypothetical protein
MKLMGADSMIPKTVAVIGLFLGDRQNVKHTGVYHFLDPEDHSLPRNETSDKIS